MWGFLQDAEVSLESINRGLMLPMSRESWVLKEAPCISSPVKKDDWERSAVAAHFIANREACQGSSRPGSRQSSRPRSRPSSTQGGRKPKRTAASLAELKESASNRAASWLRNYAAYEQSELLQVALTLGDVRRNSLQRISSAPETLRPSSATNRGPDRRGKVAGAGTNLQRSNGRHLRRQCSGPGLRCDTGEERLLRKEDRSGWPAPWADAALPSPEASGPRPNTTPSRTRDKKSEAKGATTGLVHAVECDKRFQAQLLESWRRTNGLEEASERVHRRQVCQFFDFLRKPDGDMDMESGVVPYIEEGFASAEWVEGEMARAAPDLHGKDIPSAGGELSASKKTAIRQVLVLYSQVARPQNPGSQEVIFRASFCRFILDSNLVTLEAEDTERPTYHKSVRLFDNISKFGGGGLARFANIDHCVSLVIQLMMQINMPAALAWELFEEGLQKAERTAEVLARETQQKAKECAEALAKEITEEAILERRMDMFGKHGSPPQLFQGPLAVWTRGLRFWINNITKSCMPENTADRIDQIVAHNQYIRDELIEPGCLYILMKFQGLFEELFNVYSYEEKIAIKEDENGKIRNEPVAHMSFAAFFRFCLDFSIFPSLVSFEEAWQAYRTADCVQLLGTKERPVKVKQFKKAEASPSRVSAILGLRSIVNRNRKGKERESIDFDKKTETSGSGEEEEEEEEQSSETESSEEEEEEEMIQIVAPRARGTTGEVISGDSSRVNSRVNSRTGSGDAAVHPHMRSSEKKSTQTLLLPVSPQRPRRGVNDEEVAAALRNHRRQSVGPGDDEATAQAQIAIQNADKAQETKPETKPDEVKAVAPSPKSASRSPSASGPTSHNPSPRTSPRPANKETKEGEKTEDDDTLKVPRRTSAGNRFLSVLGALDPTKVKDLDLASARENGPKKALPRVKVTADFSWLQKPFREMTDKELKGYSLLICLDDCCRDHFLNVRGLVQVGKIQKSRQGFLSYLAFMELLKKFRITHGFETSSQLQEFMQVIDPCSNGQLDPVELEKAINAVREDEARRRPNAPARGGQWAATLGEEARRLSTLPIEADVADNEVPVAFNLPAFVETLLLLGHHHMQLSGAVLKCNAASAAKSTYLINFLHHQHDRLVKHHNEQRRQATTAAAEQAATVLVRPRSPPPLVDLPKEEPKLTGSAALNKMVGAARKVLRDAKEERLVHRNAVVTAVVDSEPLPVAEPPATPGGLSRQSSEAGPLIPPSPSSRGQRTDSGRGTAQQEHWPDTASYTPVVDVLTRSNQDVFKRWMEGEGKLPQFSPWFSDSNKICSKCKRQRDSQGIGNVFCHVCSCVDAKPLNETLLYPALDRARLRRKMGSETNEHPPVRNHRASSQLSGSGVSN